MPVSLFDLSFGGALVVVVGVLLEDPDARMQMPWNLREITGRCCRLAISSGNRSEGLVPELSLGFCATGLDGVPVSRGVFVGSLVRWFVGSLMRCFVARLPDQIRSDRFDVGAARRG